MHNQNPALIATAGNGEENNRNANLLTCNPETDKIFQI
jgi:hypothetical protein